MVRALGHEPLHAGEGVVAVVEGTEVEEVAAVDVLDDSGLAIAEGFIECA